MAATVAAIRADAVNVPDPLHVEPALHGMLERGVERRRSFRPFSVAVAVILNRSLRLRR